MTRFFSIDMPGTRFVWNVFLFSLLSLLPILLLYLLLSPGFMPALIEGGPALSRFLRQVITNGMPVVFTANYLGFFLYALSSRSEPENRGSGIFLVIDLPVRLIIFFTLHAIIYVVSADWFGSFGGSRATALRVVAPTLARSAQFENISGVYLYATLLGAMPIYVSEIGRSERLRRVADWVPLGLGPVFLALLWLATGALTLTIAATMIMR